MATLYTAVVRSAATPVKAKPARRAIIARPSYAGLPTTGVVSAFARTTFLPLQAAAVVNATRAALTGVINQ